MMRGTSQPQSHYKEEDVYSFFSAAGSAAFLPPLRSRMALRSLSSLSEVMTTFEGWMPTEGVAAFDFSTWTRSTWMTHFLR